MMRKSRRLLAIGLLAGAVSIGASLYAVVLTGAAPNIAVPSSPPGAGPLDGMRFSGQIGPLGGAADVSDSFVFSEGLFVSTECESRCNFPARPYYVRGLGDGFNFVSETRCPTKNARIVWRGTVEGEAIKGHFTWTVERWYWTIEKTFWFEGTLTENAVAKGSDT